MQKGTTTLENSLVFSYKVKRNTYHKTHKSNPIPSMK